MGEVGGRRSSSRPQYRYQRQGGEHIRISARDIGMKEKRFFSNTFASEEVDEKIPCVPCCRTDTSTDDDGSLTLSGTVNARGGCSANVFLGRSRIVSDRRH